MRPIVLGTRGSALAMWQTNWVLNFLRQSYPGHVFQIKTFKTQGDKILDVALAKIGNKGLFTKELEVALLNKEIDMAVHSMKDLPTELPQGLAIGAICQRVNPLDVLISRQAFTLPTLPKYARVGTSSLRRKAQILFHRPDLQIVDLRGNIDTRISKLEKENLAAIILAAAGVERMGFQHLITEYISSDICLPAAGQGAIGLETRADDEEIQGLIAKISDKDSTLAISAERSFLRALEGGCQIPIGALGHVADGSLHLEGSVASIDGSVLIRDKVSGTAAFPAEIGRLLAEKLLQQGARQILNQVRREIDRSDI